MALIATLTVQLPAKEKTNRRRTTIKGPRTRASGMWEGLEKRDKEKGSQGLGKVASGNTGKTREPQERETKEETPEVSTWKGRERRIK